MGVPKFFRWISERYPCLSTVVRTNEMPEFDNLYLDMNGIIHVCSHPEDDNVNFRIDEETIFKHIVHYIEFLLQMIRPQKVFFLAVDGVAPRAKMNQQRSRRFRSAKVMEDQEKEALEKGTILPDTERFDSNCITPGTEFMVRLDQYIRYFVVKKVSEDPAWSKIKVIYSGHQTPGEGEHKILDFIRYQRTLTNYDPNTRHCLYGLDADLIMLGLSCHEPFCTLLREEVIFARKKKDTAKRAFVPEELSFFLLNLSLLRDYIDLEFGCLKKDGVLSFPYDLEKIIDDWIFLAFLVGNDFVPHLPNLHIHADALPMLWKCYKETIVTLKGYLHDFGDLNITRFLKLIDRLAQSERSKFDKSREGEQWMMSEKGRELGDELENLGLSEKFRELETFFGDQDELVESALEDLPDLSVDSMANGLDDEYAQTRRYYYLSKMSIAMDEEAMKRQAREYLFAMQWILFYYYRGTPCWKWFYPQHYAPFVVDLLALIEGSSITDVDDGVDDGRRYLQADWLEHVRQGHGSVWKCGCSKPFLPFQQLMAVLPNASAQLLPKCYQPLMMSEELKDLYPEHFQTDLNGKKQEWEAVVLIPFIEEERLLNALEPLQASLSEMERNRNTYGPHLVFQYSSKVQPTYRCPGASVGLSHDLVVHGNHAQCTELPMDAFWISSDAVCRTVLPGCQYRDAVHLGFPVLASRLLQRTEAKYVGVKVFEHFSRKESILLELAPYALDSYAQSALQSMVGRLLNKSLYVDWPHLREALVERVFSLSCEYFLGPDHSIKTRMLEPQEITQLEKAYVDACKALMQRRAICFGTSTTAPATDEEENKKPEKNANFSPPSSTSWIFVEARILLGCQYRMRHGKNTGESNLFMEKQWSNETERFLWSQCFLPNAQQLCPSKGGPVSLPLKVITSRQPHQMKLSDYLAPDTPITCLDSKYQTSGYGTTGKVLRSPNGGSREGDIQVILYDYHDRIDLGQLSSAYYAEESSYVNASGLLQHLQNALPMFASQLTAPLLARITGNLYVCHRDQRHNIGLNLKFNRTNECVLGYTRAIRNANNAAKQNTAREGGGSGNTWLYCHTRLVPILVHYINYCPQIVHLLKQHSSVESFDAAELFDDKDSCKDRLNALIEFVAKLPCSKAPRVGINDSLLSSELLSLVTGLVDSRMATMKYTETQRTLHFNDVYKYEPLFSGVNLNNGRHTYLLDRVVNVRSGIRVPFGLRGTVVGVVVGSATKFREWFYEVIFDLPFHGGIEIRGIKGRGYRLPESAFLNVVAKERELSRPFYPLKGSLIPCPFTIPSENVSHPAKEEATNQNQSNVVFSRPISQQETAAAPPIEDHPLTTPEDDALEMLKMININELLKPSNEPSILEQVLPVSEMPSQSPQKLVDSVMIQSFLQFCSTLGFTSPPEVKEFYIPQSDGSQLIECHMYVPASAMIWEPLTIMGLPKPTLNEALQSVVEQATIILCTPQQSRGPSQLQQSHARFPQQEPPRPQFQQQAGFSVNQQNRTGPTSYGNRGYNFSYIPPNIRDDPFRDMFYDHNREKMLQTRDRYQCDTSAIRQRGKPAMNIYWKTNSSQEQTSPYKAPTMFVPSQAMAPRNAPPNSAMKPYAANATFPVSSATTMPTQPQMSTTMNISASYKSTTNPSNSVNRGGGENSRGKRFNRRVAADFSSRP